MENIEPKGRFSQGKKLALRRTIGAILAGGTVAVMSSASAGVINDAVVKTKTTGAKGVAVSNPGVFEGDLRKLKPAAKWQPGDPIKIANPRRIRDTPEPRPAVNKTAPGDPLLAKQAKIKKPQKTADTLINVEGQGFNGVNPPDPTGDVGLNYYIQSINARDGATFRVYNKETGVAVTEDLLMSSLHTGDCADAWGDPIVLFDEQANRWLLTEFSSSAHNKLCVLVSQSDDPVTGGWYAYEFQAPYFPDYPKYSQMGGVYYASANENANAVYAFERSKMLAGEPATMVRQEISTLAGFGFNSITPVDVDGATDLPEGSPGLFIRHRDDELHNSGSNNPANDYVELWSLQPDFTTPDNSVVEGPNSIEVSEFNSDFTCPGPGFGCLTQKDTTVTLDPLRETVMYKAQYRHFGGHESIVGNFITNSGDDIAALRWFELRRVSGGDWSLNDEGTYTEGDGNNRYMAASVLDGDGNLGLAYMMTGADTYPSIAYNGRLASDEAGVLTFGEQILKAGTGTIESDRNGDYSQMGIDPVDNCTMWFTSEYGDQNGQWGTQVSSFKVPACGDPNPGFTLTATNLSQEVCASGDYAPITISASAYNEFDGDIALTYGDLPAGITASFSVDSFKVGETTQALLAVAAGTAAGSHTISIMGNSDGSREKTLSAYLSIMDTTSTATLSTPVNNAEDVAVLPSFSWADDGRADSFKIEIATDEAFSNIVAQSIVNNGNNYSPSAALEQSTVYYWRVIATNSCGELSTQVFTFTTGSETSGAIELFKGQAQGGISVEEGEMNFFYINVPEGASELEFNLAGDNGDADLYITKDAKPTSGADILCASESASSNEYCYISDDVEGLYFATVYAYSSFTDATLTATFDLSIISDGPVVTGQNPMVVEEDTGVEISLNNLTIEGDDNATYTLTVLEGENYTVHADNMIQPAADFYGEVTVNLTVSDGTNTSEVFGYVITFTPVNDVPVINPAMGVSFDEDSSLTLDNSHVNVTDVDSSSFTITVSEGENYTVDGSTITPAANYNGPLSVGVVANDGEADSNSAIMSITVNPVNDAPVAVDDMASMIENKSATINVLGNDSDIDEGDELTLAGVDYSGSGSATVVDGKVSYVPASGFVGIETFTYTVSDSAGATASATVKVTVIEAMDPVVNKPLSSGGSTMGGLLSLLLLPLIGLRRRLIKA